MLHPTVATIQSPLFSERICAEINIHVNLDQSRPDLSHVTYRTMPIRPQHFAPSALQTIFISYLDFTSKVTFANY